MSEISIHNETGAIATDVVLMFLSLLLIVLGTCFQAKIITISKREKEMTWKHDITNSTFLIFHYGHAWFFHTLTYFVQDLHHYVGKWYCYTYRILAYYGNIYTVGHSLSICSMKYILIVHWEKARNIGHDRIKNVFFWLNIIHPMINYAVHFLVYPEFILVYDGITQSNRCLGESEYLEEKENATSIVKLHHICQMVQSYQNQRNVIDMVVSIGRKSLCYLQTGSIYFMAWNIIEIGLYLHIFSFARR